MFRTNILSKIFRQYLALSIFRTDIVWKNSLYSGSWQWLVAWALLENSGYPEYLENSHSWQHDEYSNEQIFSLNEYFVDERIFRLPYEYSEQILWRNIQEEDIQAAGNGSLRELFLTQGGQTSSTFDTFLSTSTVSLAPLLLSRASISSCPYLNQSFRTTSEHNIYSKIMRHCYRRKPRLIQPFKNELNL